MKQTEEEEGKIMVEAGVKMPECYRRGAKPKYPWEKMNVGDSFFLLGGREVMRRINPTASGYGTRHGKKFTCRSVVEGEVAGVRCWRVE